MTDCAMCSACCDPVPFAREQHTAVSAWSTAALDGVPDPAAADGWAYWLASGWAEEARDAAIDRYDPAGRWRQDADFIAAHWTPDGDDGCKCDVFDPSTGLCGAHETRPPVCRDYPWYSDAPDAERAACLPSQCSYLADVPPGDRPEGSRPLIPLTVLLARVAEHHPRAVAAVERHACIGRDLARPHGTAKGDRTATAAGVDDLMPPCDRARRVLVKMRRMVRPGAPVLHHRPRRDAPRVHGFHARSLAP